ncbi:phosphoadenylyl-sulfate reductase [Rhodocyclus gracilis]|uniref:Adenosine 5'-phosphosulfate reductase n=1 Tax=Rhodocyclus tenuis TaxID=1066 RepID=A0A6L5JVY6_RHOTE|nr:phosphoadenylyl-sulfate reductase [Rhodocyclus gracilis]MQY51221.1 phosphoadenylyl-sulfate reductase [Rhodocyclus gracilis]
MKRADPSGDAVLLARIAERADEATAFLRRITDEFPAVAFASSLGVEDMLLTDLIARARLPITIFTLDTGRLPEETYALMATQRQHYGLPLQVYFPEHVALEAWVGEHGVNAFYDSVEQRRQCCRLRKVEPLGRALAGQQAWITGQRAEQSVTRAGLPLREHDAVHGIAKFNPLAEWSEREVWAYVDMHHVPYNALHDRFFPSIGCAPCTRAITPGEDVRAGRWWWENAEARECGLHPGKHPDASSAIAPVSSLIREGKAPQ